MSEVPIAPVSPSGQEARRPEVWWRWLLGRVHAARRNTSACRARRVVLLVLCLWVLNMFDLAFTILAHRIGHFEELNPLARCLVHSPAALAAFKIALLTFTSAVFLIFRHRLLTEVGCWCLAVVYTVLSVVWLTYYQFDHL